MTTLPRSLAKLYSYVSIRRRWQLMGLFFLMLIGAMAEMASLGAVVPFLSLLAEPSLANHYTWLDLFGNELLASQAYKVICAAILLAVISLGACFLRILLMWVSLRFSFGLGADLGAEIYRNTLNRSYSWHVSHNSSEILAGVEKINIVVYNVINPLIQGFVALVLVVAIIFALLMINSEIAVLAGVGFLLIYGLIALLFNRLLTRNSRVVSANMIGRLQAIQEGLGGIRDVLLDNSQDIYVKRFSFYDRVMRRAQATTGLISASPRFVVESMGMIFIAALAFWFAGQKGGIVVAIPVLGALAIGAQKLLPQMQFIYYSWASISGSREQLTDMLGLLAISKSIVSAPSVTAPMDINIYEKSSAPLVRLKNVDYRYKVDMPLVLHQINLEIPRGSHIGFVGKTGSGKSTLIDIIMALLNPTNGHIEIDGHSLTQENYRSWQQRIAHVPQSIYLSDCSIAENIAFGIALEQINFERLKSVIDKAQLAEYIATLPEGYNTRVGERGVRLSGGQRQRIGLARALYKQVDVLVLDEATSALDNATEDAVMMAIKNLGRNVTVLMIAHRISSLRHCDLIIDLANGSVMRQGKYQELFGMES